VTTPAVPDAPDAPAVRTASRPFVIVFGSINTDLVVRVPHFPRPGETLAGGGFFTAGGGKGANQAVAAARMGADVRLIGAVGADDFGARRLAELAAEGIAVGGVARLDGTTTGVALITVDAAGENTIVLDAGANAAVTLDALTTTLRGDSAGGVFVAQLELPLDVVAAALEAAKAVGLTTLLNVAPFHPEAARLLRLVDVLVVNEGEAAGLAGASDAAITPEAAGEIVRHLRARGPGIVLLTLGAAGAVIGTADVIIHIAAPPVTPVDTTGAGDCFVGVFAVGLAAGMTTEAAARRAVVAASRSIAVAGATAGMPTLAQLAHG